MKKPKHDTRIKGPMGYSGVTRGVIIHSTEGDQREGHGDRYGIIDYLASKGLSVPVVTDDDGSTQMVPDDFHGFHCKGITNCLGIEQIGRAGWSREQWLKHRKTIERAGKWCAFWLADALGVGVTEKNLKKLVVGHSHDHVFGGTSDHWDPGPNFPWDVLRKAAIDYATEVGYKVVAKKGDSKRIRRFRAKKHQMAWAFARKWAKRGYRVIVKREPLPQTD